MDPVRRVLGLPVLLQPVVERKRSRERSNLFANQLLLLGQLEVHGRDCSPTTSAAPGAGGGRLKSAPAYTSLAPGSCGSARGGGTVVPPVRRPLYGEPGAS